jgi:hypothetical protein
MFRGVLKAQEGMITRAWEIMRKYAETEILIKKSPEMSKEDQEKIRVVYDRQQIDLELSFESAANLLWFFIDSESHSGGNENSDAVIACKEETLRVMKLVITTPIVASACSSMFQVYIDALL